MAIVHFVNYKRGTQSRAAMRGVMLYVMQEKKSAWEEMCIRDRCWLGWLWGRLDWQARDATLPSQRCFQK